MPLSRRKYDSADGSVRSIEETRKRLTARGNSVSFASRYYHQEMIALECLPPQVLAGVIAAEGAAKIYRANIEVAPGAVRRAQKRQKTVRDLVESVLLTPRQEIFVATPREE